MLVLSRRPGGEIFIYHPDGDITITIVNVTGSKVRIGIDAPKSMRIDRDDMKSHHLEGSYPCTKCGQPSWALNSLCFRHNQIENGE